MDAIYITKARLSFPKLIEAVAPVTPPNAAAKYGCDLLLTPDHPAVAQFMGAVSQVAMAKWKDSATPILKHIETDRRLRCWGRGEEKLKKETMKPYAGYDGMLYINASAGEDHPPMMVDAEGNQCPNDNTMLRKELARKLYGGCYVNAAISLWAQDNQFGRAIRCNLIAVQFAGEGDAFGDSPPDLSGMFKAAGAPAAAAPAPTFPSMPWMQ